MKSYTKGGNGKRLFRAILLNGLLVGTLDISAAFIQAGIRGVGPERVLRYVASGFFGDAAFSGSVIYAFFGLFFHYCIALCWTILFFILYARFRLWKYNRGITGIGYGVLVGLLMNFVVVPLSSVPRGPVELSSVIVAIAILIVAIGIPLSFGAHSFYSGLRKAEER
ncbi:hypothetical protein ED312_19915 [Sinomicrobium pectinilyticum]|uniref:DUF1440 domain-containing protein n=1 Tax=Sinomicrobium pectinilyticum TaxID=1084421 RepID=A0A3N0DR11_SINP1|nr:hypothetical protein [Sinomicrobium pectinilyticum]RNL78067.1 hypothetical protein ED312_19915 [Sinomicrobium pectinilyticum]